ncbi:MAG: YceI family protein [Myxococcales bacterium]|nr:YceI family protein [Myxococcales bacterium]
MARFDSTTASCEIHTFKEGLLAAMGHDLKIAVDRLEITVDDASRAVQATFQAGSLRVVGALSGSTLSDKDRAEIEANIRKKVLDPDRYPEIRFASTAVEDAGEGLRIRGDLTLHGQTRPIAFTTRPEGDRQVAEVTLSQPEFGIKPYKAPLGVIKIKPEVRVLVSVPWPKSQA